MGLLIEGWGGGGDMVAFFFRYCSLLGRRVVYKYNSRFAMLAHCIDPMKGGVIVQGDEPGNNWLSRARTISVVSDNREPCGDESQHTHTHMSHRHVHWFPPVGHTYTRRDLTTRIACQHHTTTRVMAHAPSLTLPRWVGGLHMTDRIYRKFLVYI